ncbi:hypothetical protein PF005_g6613 [Phytophthora fragariae]|uniref:Nucleolar protein 10 n=2 Tax=Phytophthora fragariae TaxID=53985 RepID=A0A6A3YSI7_9STRA|nr:hypothetical protein PF007_g5257 [Phytophthora fragariae]KAE9222683.1 hypothetical protein PF005_g6613 [Phytophthora fragariae]
MTGHERASKPNSAAHSSPTRDPQAQVTMHLMYYLGDDGKRVYTLKKETSAGAPTCSAHPARFSPDDKFSKERITTKKRFGLLPTQSPDPIFQ